MDATVSLVAEHDDEDSQEAWEWLTRRGTESEVTLIIPLPPERNPAQPLASPGPGAGAGGHLGSHSTFPKADRGSR